MTLNLETIPNAVSGRLTPWYMQDDADQIADRTDPSVRPYVKSLVDDGVAVIPNSLPNAVCDAAVEAFRRAERDRPDIFDKHRDEHGHYPRIVNIHIALPEFFRLFSDNHLSKAVQAAMFGAEPCLYSSLLFERGSAQDIHRDTPYFTTRPEYFYLGVWVALEDANEENGTLQVVRGGHRIPEIDRETLALQHYEALDKIDPASAVLWDDYQKKLQDDCTGRKLVVESIPVKKGSTIIWHPQLPHGGGPIKDIRRTRFSFVTHTTPLGVPVYHQNAFYNPKGDFSKDAPWQFVKDGDSYRAFHSHWAVGHYDLHEPGALPRPAAPPPPRPSLTNKIMGALTRRIGYGQ